MSDTALQRNHGSFLTQSLERATVAEAMHPGILSCEPDAPLTEVAKMMAAHHVHCVAVIGISHEDPECFVWGIVSDRDLLRAGVSEDAPQSARALATQPLVVVEPGMPLREAAREMAAHGVSHVVVSDPVAHRPIGVLSTLDVAGVLAWGEA
jgi:CBS domain-containing protein